MESPRNHLQEKLEPLLMGSHEPETSVSVTLPSHQFRTDETTITHNHQDKAFNTQTTPRQDFNNIFGVSYANKSSGEKAHHNISQPHQEDGSDEGSGNIAEGSQQAGTSQSRPGAKGIIFVNNVEKSSGIQVTVTVEQNRNSESSNKEQEVPTLNVLTAEEKSNEERRDKSGSPSRLKDRSPNLKLLILDQSSSQKIAEHEKRSSFSESVADSNTNTLNGETLHPPEFGNIKKSLSQSEIQTGEELKLKGQEGSPGMKRISSVATMSSNNKPEENKSEPPSATQQTPTKTKVTMEDFHKITSVGKGSYAEVFLVKKISNNKLYALKAIDKNFMKKEKKEHQVYVEREVLLKLNHPNIIKLFSSFQDKNKLYFVLEYVSGGEFSDYLRVQGKLTKDQIVFFAAEVINILEYLHTFGVAHRDLKPENLLLTQEGHLKCIDFGTAKFLTTDKRTSELFSGKTKPAEETLEMNTSVKTRAHRSTFVGTAQYVSPEMLEGSDCGAPADLWALGCMVYLMTVGQYPFADTNEYLIFQKIKSVSIKYPDDMDLEIKDLVQKLLVKDPNMRLGAGPKGSKNDYDALKAHSLFRNINFEKLHEQQPPVIEIASPHKRRSQDFDPNSAFVSNQQQNRRHCHSDDLSQPTPKDNSRAVEFPTDKTIRVILSGLVLKKTAWLFYRPRQLILNSMPRLVYYDPDSNQLKGEIPLAPTTKAELESKTKFTITTPKKKYVFKEMEHSAEKWVEIVNTAVQQLYGKKAEKK